jgi:hypothetical protein
MEQRHSHTSSAGACRIYGNFCPTGASSQSRSKSSTALSTLCPKMLKLAPVFASQTSPFVGRQSWSRWLCHTCAMSFTNRRVASTSVLERQLSLGWHTKRPRTRTASGSVVWRQRACNASRAWNARFFCFSPRAQEIRLSWVNTLIPRTISGVLKNDLNKSGNCK